MYKYLFFLFFVSASLFAKVQVGLDLVFEPENIKYINGKNIGILTNQTGVNSQFESTISLFKQHGKHYKIKALFAPEHGITGVGHAAEKIKHDKTADGIPVFSLHGAHKRPTENMLKNIDLIIFDIQDLGVRSYTYAASLFYMMEEAAKYKKEVLVLDRPNPINGSIVDGPLLNLPSRSFLGYVNVPYIHGMTIGELAHFFNHEYKVGCKLKVIQMKGWNRKMSFKETKLPWVPTSPHIPEPDTAMYYATTGLIGELGMVNIGVGYTLPFKIIGSTWIDADKYAKSLNDLKLSGIKFLPIHFKPFYGSYKAKNCQGVLLQITDPTEYYPFKTCSAILGILKSLYPKEFKQALSKVSKKQQELFIKTSGSEHILPLLEKEKYVTWKLISMQQEGVITFSEKRKKYLFPSYK